MYKHFFKRAIDFTIVLIALMIVWPILLVIYIWLTIANKGAGALFYQERPCKDGKTFKGYMVGIDQQGQGVAREMGIAMNRVATELGLRMFKSISPENPASMAVTQKVNDIKIIKTLDNGDMLIECFEKVDIQHFLRGDFPIIVYGLRLIVYGRLAANKPGAQIVPLTERKEVQHAA